MSVSARYAHTNLVALDWRRLASFYQDLFGCQPVGSRRHARGAWVEELTSIEAAEVDGIHLRLPGFASDGPTLEIFQYSRHAEWHPPVLNQPGFAHIAFEVDDVRQARQAALDLGASEVGKVLTTDIPGAGTITVVYMADPEGNLFELQHWHGKKAT